MKRLILLASLILWTACGGGGSGVGENNPAGNPEENVGLGNLFDIWTLTPKNLETNCPGVEQNAEEIFEEILVGETEEGCFIEDELPDGTELSNNELLYDDEETRCRINGNQLHLEFDVDLSDLVEGCQLTLRGQSVLNLAGENSLVGSYRIDGEYSGECGVDIDTCFITVSLEGQRGRQAPQDDEGEMAGGEPVIEPVIEPVAEPEVDPAVDPEEDLVNDPEEEEDVVAEPAADPEEDEEVVDPEMDGEEEEEAAEVVTVEAVNSGSNGQQEEACHSSVSFHFDWDFGIPRQVEQEPCEEERMDFDFEDRFHFNPNPFIPNPW